MKVLKAILLPIRYAIYGFSFTISTFYSLLCDGINWLLLKIGGTTKFIKTRNFFENQKEHPENFLLTILYLVAILSFINIFVPKNSNTFGTNAQSQVSYEDVSTIETNNDSTSNTENNNNTNYNTNTIIDFTSLKTSNPDTVAYLEVLDTNISYPVVQTTDNDYYLTHDFNKTYSQRGAIFADYRNSFDTLSKNTIIYGHHRLDNTMFGQIDVLFTNDYLQNKDHIILLKTENKTYTFKVFSVYEIDPEVYYLTTSFQSDSSYLDFLNTLKQRSVFNFNEELDANTKIITLSTCNLDNTGRLVVHGKLIGER